MKKVLVFGTFDNFHPGHLNFFKQAEKLGDLTVIIARDKTVEELKGHLPKQDENQRLARAQKQKTVCNAMLGNLDDPYRIIKQQKPDIIALGYDQNSFSKNLENKIKDFNLNTKIIRLKPYKAEIYKSSILK